MERIQESLGNIHKCDLKENKKGITLVALVITIVILLILAGISISALTNTGLFRKAKEAKSASENAEKEQNKILGEYETALDQYDEKTLAYKVNNRTIKVGDYVRYTPDTVTKDDKNYKTLISNLETYSGSDNNTESTLNQDELNWRVLDVKDGNVRLISAEPTTSKITLNGYNGYNNAVKLLDDTCSTLYNNLKFSNNVQNLKIEDIQGKIIEKDFSNFNEGYGEKYEPKDINYPQIMEREEKYNVDKSINSKDILSVSKQNEFITGSALSSNNSLERTFWAHSFKNSNEFINKIFYEMIIGDETNAYWISSRCVDPYVNEAYYLIRYVNGSYVHAYGLYNSNKKETPGTFAFRPVITLNSNVQLDTTKTGDGSSAEHAYEIK